MGSQKSFEEYIDIYNKLIHLDVPDKIACYVSLIYKVENKEFIKEAYLDLTKIINNKFDFSIMGNKLAYIFSSLLLVKYEFPFVKVNQLIKTVELIHNIGFETKVVDFMAYIIMDEEEKVKLLDDTDIIYKQIQSTHSFITNEEDYLHCLSFARTGKKVETLLSESQYYYDNLNNKWFQKKDVIQLLANELVLVDGNKEDLIHKMLEILEKLKNYKIRLKSEQYLLMCLLLDVKNFDNVLIRIKSEYDTLKEYYKDDKIIIENLYVILVLININKYNDEISRNKYNVNNVMNHILLIILIKYLKRMKYFK